MTRLELRRLKNIANALASRPEIAALELNHVIAAAEREHAAEDRYHDAAEADAYPINAQVAA